MTPRSTVQTAAATVPGLLLALITACEPGSVRLLLRYPDQAAYDRARSVELRTASNATCAQLATDPDAALVFDAHGPGPTPEPARTGQLALWVAVRDAACLRFLSHCQEVKLTAGRDQTVILALLPVGESGCRSDLRCERARCVAADADAASLDVVLADRAVADAVADTAPTGDAVGPHPDAAHDGGSSDGAAPIDATRSDASRVVVLQDDNAADFSRGGAQGVVNVGGSLVLADGGSVGIFESRWLSHDGGHGTLTAFEWQPTAPYGKQLPDLTRAAAEVAAYPAGGLDLTGLVLLLHFSGAPGTPLPDGWRAAETSGGDHAVEFVDNPAALSSRLVDGKVGTAVFIERDDYFILQDADSSTEFHFVDGAFSYAVWVRIASCEASSNTSVVAIGGEVPHIWLGAACPAGVAYWIVRDDDGTGIRVTSATSIVDDRWHHLVGVKEALPERIMLYVDGVAVSSSTSHWGTLGNPTKKIFLGNFPMGLPPLYQYPSELAIDELAIFARALRADEVRALYARAATAARFQLWICSGPPAQCDLETPLWVGPDGTPATSFDELTNFTPLPRGPVTPMVDLAGHAFKYRLLLGRDDLALDPAIEAVRMHLRISGP